LSLGSLLRSFWLLYFSKPASDRKLYQSVRAKAVRSIVELGVGLPLRTPRLLQFAAGKASSEPIRYCGIDLFEARPSGQPALSLKQAFSALQFPSIRVQLVPGDPYTALRRVANSLTGTDLLLIAATHDQDSLARAWTWMPRMLTASSLIFLEQLGAQPGTTVWKELPLADVQRLAAESSKSLRRAA
jgi:hypothetical protein